MAAMTALFMSLTACEQSVSISNRSGSLSDDYVAEPLSERSKKYENALNVSNEIIKKVIEKDFTAIYEMHFDAELKSQMTKEQFIQAMNQLINSFGSATKYKELQWGFFSRNSEGRNLIFSKKIVEHEKSMVKYLFAFKEDGKYMNIVGFNAHERTGVTPPGVY